MKVIPIMLAEHYRQPTTTLAMAWRIQRKDGRVFTFTDHDDSIVFEGETYMPLSAFDSSAVNTKGDLSVDNLEVIGVLTDDDGVTAESIEAGQWDGASIEIRRVNWASPSMGAEIVRVGELGNITRKEGQYTAEMRGLLAHLANNIQRLITPSCNATLGDSRCKVDLDALDSDGAFRYSGEVTTVQGTQNRIFTSDDMPAIAGYFDGGYVTFTSGANDGISMEVKAFIGGDNFTLQLPMPFPIELGDTFVATAGCDKEKPTCIAKFDNLVNFRGFSFVPGTDKVLLVGV